MISYTEVDKDGEIVRWRVTEDPENYILQSKNNRLVKDNTDISEFNWYDIGKLEIKRDVPVKGDSLDLIVTELEAPTHLYSQELIKQCKVAQKFADDKKLFGRAWYNLSGYSIEKTEPEYTIFCCVNDCIKVIRDKVVEWYETYPEEIRHTKGLSGFEKDINTGKKVCDYSLNEDGQIVKIKNNKSERIIHTTTPIPNKYLKDLEKFPYRKEITTWSEKEGKLFVEVEHEKYKTKIQKNGIRGKF